jgi:uncharacterized protein
MKGTNCMNRLSAYAICFALCSTSALAQQNAPPANPITPEQTREIYRLTGVPALMHAMAKQALTLQRANSPEYIPDSVWQDLASSFDKIDLAGALTAAYQKYLSEEDGEKIIAFYKTPEGQHLLAAAPAIMQSAGEVAKREGAKVGMQVFARHTDEIIEAKKKFDADQKREQEEISKPPATSNPH